MAAALQIRWDSRDYRAGVTSPMVCGCRRSNRWPTVVEIEAVDINVRSLHKKAEAAFQRPRALRRSERGDRRSTLVGSSEGVKQSTEAFASGASKAVRRCSPAVPLSTQ